MAELLQLPTFVDSPDAPTITPTSTTKVFISWKDESTPFSEVRREQPALPSLILTGAPTDESPPFCGIVCAPATYDPDLSIRNAPPNEVKWMLQDMRRKLCPNNSSCRPEVNENPTVLAAETRLNTIYFKQAFFDEVANRLGLPLRNPDGQWSEELELLVYGMLAHEFAHYYDFRITKYQATVQAARKGLIPPDDLRKQQELFADITAACFLAQTEIGQTTAAEANTLSRLTAFFNFAEYQCPGYPTAEKRVEAMRNGWMACKGQQLLFSMIADKITTKSP